MATTAEQIAVEYQGGAPPSKLTSRFGASPKEIAKILDEKKIPIRQPGRPVGWRKLTAVEISRLRDIGKSSKTWEEFRVAAGYPEGFNVKVFRRWYGVRLACFVCGRFPSTGRNYIDGVIRQVCDRHVSKAKAKTKREGGH